MNAGETGPGAARDAAAEAGAAPQGEARARADSRPRIELMGLEIDAVTEREALERVRSQALAGRGGWVITPNVDQLRQFVAEPALRPLFAAADVVVADGTPLIWASRLQGTPLPERVPGSDLIWSLSALAAAEGLSIFLLGGEPGVAEQACKRLRERNPELRVSGVHCPPFGFESNPEELARILAALRAAAPRIVFVGLGFPKQERLIAELREQFPDTWFLGVGISLSFVAGVVERAPLWMHGLGIEWLHRLAREPRRLFRRYVVHGIPFGLRLIAHSLWRRARGGPRGA